eukprot:GHVU01187958.1.p2 GENE.GHVU01187958.1~~GHVU01187958.1.p2  ORF type:complete len:143 (+),score=6.72 GHVU01187958.1:312-740(+)
MCVLCTLSSFITSFIPSHSLLRSFTHSLIHSLTHSLARSFVRSLSQVGEGVPRGEGVRAVAARRRPGLPEHCQAGPGPYISMVALLLKLRSNMSLARVAFSRFDIDHRGAHTGGQAGRQIGRRSPADRLEGEKGRMIEWMNG